MTDQEMAVAIDKILNDMAVITTHVRETRTEVAALTHQVKYLSQLMEDVAMEGQQATDESKDALTHAYDFLEKSPMAKHPMFKEMIGPLQEMMKKQKA